MDDIKNAYEDWQIKSIALTKAKNDAADSEKKLVEMLGQRGYPVTFGDYELSAIVCKNRFGKDVLRLNIKGLQDD